MICNQKLYKLFRSYVCPHTTDEALSKFPIKAVRNAIILEMFNSAMKSGAVKSRIVNMISNKLEIDSWVVYANIPRDKKGAIYKVDSDGEKIAGPWNTLSNAAYQSGVSINAISKSIVMGYRCKGYFYVRE